MNKLLLILSLKTLILALIIGFSHIGLAPDEAQYWTWSQELDWGYYSKPPGIAWQIWLTSSLFGNTVFGVKAGALIVGFLVSLAVYAVARAADLSQNAAFWSAIVAAFCPLGVYLSFAATTDAGMILCLTLAAAVLIKGSESEKGPNYLLVGACICAGACFKWTAYLFWPLIIVYLPYFPKLRTWGLLFGCFLSFAALLPSFYWNAAHEWATLRHVGKTVSESAQGNFFDFLAAQIGLLIPIFFVLLVISYFFLKKAPRKLWIIAGFPALACVYLMLSFFKKMQPNWSAYLYPAGLPLIAWVCCDRLKRGKIWLYLGTGLSISVVAVMFAIPWLQESDRLALSYSLNPFRQTVGWNRLGDALVDAGYSPEKDFLFSDKYQATSLLSFYSPEQKRAYHFNISHTRKNQFSFWPQMHQEEIGKRGFFVVLENTEATALSWYQEHYSKRLAPYFERVSYSGAYPLFSAAQKPVKYAMIFECTNYSGDSPPEVKAY